LIGLLAIVTALRVLFRQGLPPGSLLGFLLTGLASIGLGAFILSWGLSPF